MRTLALSLWLIALLAATAGFALGHTVYDRGVAYGDPGPALPDLDGPVRAVNTQLEVEPDEASQRRALQLIRAAGFGWIRQQFSWDAVEGGGKGASQDATTGRSTWESHDRIVRLAGEAGLRVIARLELPPAWARPPGSTKTHPPLDVRDYGDFVARFVERYAGRVGHVQLWNEPNLVGEWGGQPVDPAAYVELLKAGARGARRADPAVRVLSAMLAPTLEPDRPDARGLDDLLYLDRMYLHGAQPHFDILAGNAYGLHTGPEDRQVGPEYTNFPRVLLTRQVMLRHGDGGKAVWITEFGWNALPAGWEGDPSPWGEVSSDQQAGFIVGAYGRATREWPWVGPMALWLFRQPNPDPRDPTAYFGLVDPQWRPRPAYEALRETAEGPASTLGPGVHQESSAGLRFGGTWQWRPDAGASLGALRESPVSGATLRFRFRGTRLELLAPTGPSQGTARVTIDGAPTLANRLPLSPAGQATLDLYAPETQEQRRLVLADGLPDREHDVELIVTGEASPLSGGPGVAVDALIVSRSRPVLPAVALAGLWAGSALAALLALRTPVRQRALTIVSAAVAAGETGARNGKAFSPSPSGGGPRSGRRGWGVRATGAWAPPELEALSPTQPNINPRLIQAVFRLPWRLVFPLAIAAALPLAPLSVRTPAGRFSPLELLLLLYAAIGCLWLYVRPPREGARAFRLGLFGGPALLTVAAGALTLLVAPYPWLALREWRVVVLGPAAFYLLARTALRGRRDALLLAWAFLGGAAGAAGLALAQVALGTGLVEAEGVGRAVALYRSPNNLALLLDRALPLALALALGVAGAAPERLRRQKRLLLVVAAVLAVALFFTYSRGAWVAAGVACAAVVAPAVRRLPAATLRRVAVAGVVAAVPVLVGAALVALRVERFRSLLAPEGTAVLRLRLWQSALEMARDHPWWGIGLDQFLYLYPRYMHPAAWREPNLSHPHNLVLDFWLRLGVLGLIALGWAVYVAVRRLRLPHDGIGAPLAYGAGCALLAAVVHGLMDNSFFVIDLAFGTWVLLLVLELATDQAEVPAP